MADDDLTCPECGGPADHDDQSEIEKLQDLIMCAIDLSGMNANRAAFVLTLCLADHLFRCNAPAQAVDAITKQVMVSARRMWRQMQEQYDRDRKQQLSSHGMH